VVPPLAGKANWNSFGKVVRARVRQVVLDEIAKPSPRGAAGKCASEIRKNLLERSPMELSRTIRAVDELSRLKLIRVTGWTPKPRRKLYRLTPAGRRVVKILKQAGSAALRPANEDRERGLFR
jgi:DNA-binding HxlR family transcriptional regulator